MRPTPAAPPSAALGVPALSRLLARAALLPPYRTLWAGRVPRALQDTPFLTAWTWRRTIHSRPGPALAALPALWALHAVPGDDPLWVPFAGHDVTAHVGRVSTMFREAGVRDGDVVLSVAPPGPWAANPTPYLLSAPESLAPASRTTRPRVEVFPLSALTVGFKPDLTLFPSAQRPTVLLGAAADLLAIDDLARQAGALAWRCRLALVYGPPVASDRLAALAETRVDLLHLPGALGPFGGRPGVPGVWLPADAVSAELIPDDEWGRSVQNPAYVPAALSMEQARGMTGELVVTLANVALPVIRCRTQERVRVRDADARGVRVERLGASPQPTDVRVSNR